MGQRAYTTLQQLELFAANVMLAVSLFMLLFSAAIFVKFPPANDANSHWWTIMLYFPQTWAYWLLQTFLFVFQPNVGCVNAITLGGHFKWVRFLTCGVAGIGQWMQERQSVIDTLRQRVKERGEANFIFASDNGLSAGLEARLVSTLRIKNAAICVLRSTSSVFCFYFALKRHTSHSFFHYFFCVMYSPRWQVSAMS